MNAEPEIDYERLISALATREIQEGVRQSDIDIREGDSEEEGEANYSREEVLNYFEENPEDAEELYGDLVYGAKLRILEEWENKLEHIEGTGDTLHVVADALNLREVCYYDSYFTYTNHTTRVYEASELGGVLGDIAEEAASATEAREMFTEFASEESDLDEAYAQAAEEIPAPLIGNVGDRTRPRVVEFEDENHLYVEYWSRGNSKDGFDISTGDYTKIQTAYRAVLRVDLETGLIETTGDSSQKSNEGLVERFLSEFNGSGEVSRVHIRGDDVRETKQNLALLTTLNEFVGEDAKLRFTRNNSGNVEADPVHDEAEENRDYSRSNFQIIIGQQSNNWELVYPPEVMDEYVSEGAEAETDDEGNEFDVGAVLTAMEGEEDERGDYDDAMNLTLGLNSEKATFRIQKKAMSPNTRRQVFGMLAENLDWE